MYGGLYVKLDVLPSLSASSRFKTIIAKIILSGAAYSNLEK